MLHRSMHGLQHRQRSHIAGLPGLNRPLPPVVLQGRQDTHPRMHAHHSPSSNLPFAGYFDAPAAREANLMALGKGGAFAPVTLVFTALAE